MKFLHVRIDRRLPRGSVFQPVDSSAAEFLGRGPSAGMIALRHHPARYAWRWKRCYVLH
jgi:hypothetical protein